MNWKETAEAYRGAAAYLRRFGWKRDGYGGRIDNPKADGPACALGALYSQREDWWSVLSENWGADSYIAPGFALACEKLEDRFATFAGINHRTSIPLWNDKEVKGAEDVIAAFERAAEKAEGFALLEAKLGGPIPENADERELVGV